MSSYTSFSELPPEVTATHRAPVSRSPVGKIGGNKVEAKPLIPGMMKVGIVFGLALLAVLITLTVLTSRGQLGLNLFALKISLTILGGSQGIGAVLLGIFYRNQKKLQKKNEERMQMNARADRERADLAEAKKEKERREKLVIDDDSDIDDPVSEEEKPLALGPATSEDWKAILTSEPKNGRFYNLIDVNQPIAENTQFGMPQIPLFGQYNNKENCYDAPLMCARLPSSHIASFPKPIATWLTQDQENKPIPPAKQNVECFFMVFDNTKELEDIRRNLALHAMALPEYDPEFPNSPSGRPSGIRSTENGIATTMQIAMHNPQGVLAGKREDRGAIQKDVIREMNLSIHKSKESDTQLSPNNAYVGIHPHAPVSSAFFGAKFRGKAVAIHAIILNKKATRAGGQLSYALGLKDPNVPTVATFLERVERKGFVFGQDIERTFTHPNDLKD